MLVLLYGSTTLTWRKHLVKKLGRDYHFKEILVVVSHKAPTVQPLTLRLSNAGYCLRSKDEIISDVFQHMDTVLANKQKLTFINSVLTLSTLPRNQTKPKSNISNSISMMYNIEQTVKKKKINSIMNTETFNKCIMYIQVVSKECTNSSQQLEKFALFYK